MNIYEIESTTLPVFDEPSYSGNIVGRVFKGDMITAEAIAGSVWAETEFAGQKRYICVSPLYTTQITGTDWQERYNALREAVQMVSPLLDAIRSTLRDGLLDS